MCVVLASMASPHVSTFLLFGGRQPVQIGRGIRCSLQRRGLCSLSVFIPKGHCYTKLGCSGEAEGPH